jgi:hypothetical protein
MHRLIEIEESMSLTQMTTSNTTTTPMSTVPTTSGSLPIQSCQLNHPHPMTQLQPPKPQPPSPQAHTSSHRHHNSHSHTKCYNSNAIRRSSRPNVLTPPHLRSKQWKEKLRIACLQNRMRRNRHLHKNPPLPTVVPRTPNSSTVATVADVKPTLASYHTSSFTIPTASSNMNTTSEEDPVELWKEIIQEELLLRRQHHIADQDDSRNHYCYSHDSPSLTMLDDDDDDGNMDTSTVSYSNMSHIQNDNHYQIANPYRYHDSKMPLFSDSVQSPSQLLLPMPPPPENYSISEDELYELLLELEHDFACMQQQQLSSLPPSSYGTSTITATATTTTTGSSRTKTEDWDGAMMYDTLQQLEMEYIQEQISDYEMWESELRR